MESFKIVQGVIVRMPDSIGRTGRAGAARTADPFIWQLIACLQAEVRRERVRCALPTSRFRQLHDTRSAQADQAEAELTWRDTPLHFTAADFDGWERNGLLKGDR